MDPAPDIDGFSDLVAIGTGGQATVYRGYTTTSDRLPVAVKVYPATLDEAGRRRFLREVQALRELRYEPNVVRIVQAHITASGQPYVATDLYQYSMADRILDSGPLPMVEMLRAGIQVAKALDAAHRLPDKIVHRDIKPSNILVRQDGTVALGDFGIVAIERETDLTATVGNLTPGYASPEVLGQEPATELSDIYSLGLTLLHLVRGGKPPKRPLSFAGLPRPVAEVLRRATLEKPAARYPSAMAMATALREALTAVQSADPETTAVAHRPEATLVDSSVPVQGRAPAHGQGTTAVQGPPAQPTPVLVDLPDRDETSLGTGGKFAAAWAVTVVLLLVAGWPWWGVLGLLAVGVAFPAVAFASSGARTARLIPPGAGPVAVIDGIGALVALTHRAQHQANVTLQIATIAVSFTTYLIASLFIARHCANRDTIASATAENARRTRALQPFLRRGSFVCGYPEPWLNEVLEVPNTWIFQLHDERFRYAVVCSRTVLLVAHLQWPAGRYRLSGDILLRGGANDRPRQEQLRFLADHGQKVARRWHDVLRSALPDAPVALVPAVIVTPAPDQRGEVELPPSKYPPELGVLGCDNRGSALVRFLASRVPDRRVDVDLLIAIGSRSVERPEFLNPVG